MQLCQPMDTQPTPLAKYRSTKGLSLDDLAVPLGVNKTTVMRWESGSHPIPLKRLAAVEKLTGIPKKKLRPDLVEMMRAG